MAYEDLLKDTSESFENGNYFNVTITDLGLTDVADSYPIQFRWKFKDGTYSNWSAVKNVEVPAIQLEAPAVPSTPTVRPVLGAIEVSWDGKTSTGANQANQSDFANIYIGTSSTFTPTDSGGSANLVDVLDFANNKNSVYIGVDTVVNGSLTISYGVDYYIKIIASNRDGVKSTAVAATGNPVRVGTVSSDGIVTVTADKIATGTISTGSTITVGSTSGKHVIIRGTGNPLEIYGSGGTAGGTVLSFDTNGDLTIKGTINATAGEFSGYMSAGSMKIGSNVNGTNDGLFMGTDNYWYNTGIFKVGSTSKNLFWDGSNLSITNSGSVSIEGTGSTDSITTQLDSNGFFSIKSTNNGYYDWSGTAIEIATGVKHSKINPGVITVSLDNDPSGSSLFYSSRFSIMALSNETLFDWDDDIRWGRYNYTSGYTSAVTFGLALGGINPSRSIVVSEDGTQYLGHRNYYGAASSSTMASATFGVDGDLYLSTNES